MDLRNEPYGLDADFERLVVWYCSTNPSFWSLVGYALDPSALEVEYGKLIVDTCRQIAREAGRGPSSTLLVLQRLKRRLNEGKVTVDQIQGIAEFYDYVEDNFDPIPELELVVNEILPVVKRRFYSQAIVLSHAEWAKKGDFASVKQILDQAEALGTKENVSGIQLGPVGFDKIEQSKTMDRLPTGILELDLKLNGGSPRRSLGIWMADSGGGKSMALVHQNCEALRRQMFTGFITLELPEHIQLARHFANITGVPVNDILDIEGWRDEAKRRLTSIQDKLGLCELGEMPPHATTVSDVINWVDNMEQKHGAKMEALIIDYADKLTARGIREDNTYLMGRQIYEGLRRDIAMERGMWVWTGSQAGRGDKKKRKLDLGDISDSMHKVRVADIVISLNHDGEGQVDLFVAKNRLGSSKYSVGPLITDFERARLVPATTELGQW